MTRTAVSFPAPFPCCRATVFSFAALLCWTLALLAPALAAEAAQNTGQSVQNTTLPDAAQNPASLSGALAGRRFSATRAFAPDTAEEDAVLAAATAARAAAMQRVVRELVLLPEVRIAGSIAPAADSPNLLALAHATARTSVLLISRSRKAFLVTVTVTLDPDDEDAPSMEMRVRDALTHPERLLLYEKAVLREKALLAAYDALVPTPQPTAPSTRRGDDEAVKAVTNEIRALAVFTAQLPHRNGLWKDPAAVRLAMLDALALAPESALCRNAMGDAALQLGRSQEAMEEQTRAIRSDPSFARAYHSRGAAALALAHHSSAVADFSEAIRLSPQTAAYYRARGMARHLLGETEAMCADLYEACSLGECDEFQWADANRLCPAPASRAADNLQ